MRYPLSWPGDPARGIGPPWSSPQMHAWTVRDGMATVFWQFQGDQQTEDEFGA